MTDNRTYWHAPSETFVSEGDMHGLVGAGVSIQEFHELPDENGTPTRKNQLCNDPVQARGSKALPRYLRKEERQDRFEKLLGYPPGALDEGRLANTKLPRHPFLDMLPKSGLFDTKESE